MSIEKIQLFHPPKDSDYKDFEVEKLKSLPMGLELIAKKIEKENPKTIVEVFDGNIKSLEEMLESISSGIVGVSDWYSKHKNALKLLEEAKKKGSITVMGGPNATHCAERILDNHEFVDYVVAGDGEETMSMLTQGQKPENIPNLYYRDKNKKIVFSFHKKTKLDNKFDYSHIDEKTLNHYLENNNPFLISSIRGCIKATRDKRCIFCSLPEKGIRLMRPKLVWDQIRDLNKKYGAKYFFETGDSFFVGNYPELLLENRPGDMDSIQLRIYASPEQINEKNVNVLKKLNVKKFLSELNLLIKKFWINWEKNIVKKTLFAQ